MRFLGCVGYGKPLKQGKTDDHIVSIISRATRFSDVSSEAVKKAGIMSLTHPSLVVCKGLPELTLAPLGQRAVTECVLQLSGMQMQ